MYNRKIQDKQNDVVCTLFLFCLLLIVCILKFSASYSKYWNIEPLLNFKMLTKFQISFWITKHLKLLTKVLIKSQNVVFQLTQLAIQNSLNRKKSLEKLSQLCIWSRKRKGLRGTTGIPRLIRHGIGSLSIAFTTPIREGLNARKETNLQWFLI